jgi:hypothetical protein
MCSTAVSMTVQATDIIQRGVQHSIKATIVDTPSNLASHRHQPKRGWQHSNFHDSSKQQRRAQIAEVMRWYAPCTCACTHNCLHACSVQCCHCSAAEHQKHPSNIMFTRCSNMTPVLMAQGTSVTLSEHAG